MAGRKPTKSAFLALAAVAAIGPWAVAGEPPPNAPPTPAEADAFAASLPVDQRADLAFLAHLGWRVAIDPKATAPEFRGGTPARRANLAAAQAAGDLLIVVPPKVPAEAAAKAGAALSALADGADSRCAWQFRVQEAGERATATLSAAAKRGDYVFPRLLVVNSPFFTLDPPAPEWARRGDLWVPTVKPSEAIEAFYRKKSVAECFVAQTVASLATQYELYGPQAFDATFTPEELGIGWVKPYYATPFGHSMEHDEEHAWLALLVPSDQAGQDVGLVLSRLGPRAFAGLTGVLMDPRGRELVNENFTVVTVSDAACDQLSLEGGFAYVKRLTKEALDLDARTRTPFATAAEIDPLRARIGKILQEPVMTGVHVYIHPYGVVTLGEMADKKRRKERTAVEAVVYAGGREDAYFHRWRAAFLARWKRDLPPAPPAAPPAPAPAPSPGKG